MKERLEMSLVEAVPSLPDDGNNAVDLCAIAQRLLLIIKDFHGKTDTVTDVKSDNFMRSKRAGSVTTILR